MTSFEHDLLHILRSQELALLDIDGLTALGTGGNEVCLTAKESRRLKKINDRGDFRNLIGRMNVGDDRNADLTTNFFQNTQAVSHSQAAKTRIRGTICLVVACFKHIRDPEFIGDLFHLAGDIKCELLALDDARTGKKNKGSVQTDFKTA